MASNYIVPDSPVSASQKVVDLSFNNSIYVYRSDAQFSGQTTILGSNTRQSDVVLTPYSSATANPGKIISHPLSDLYSPDVYAGISKASVPSSNLLFRYKSSSYVSGNWDPSSGSIGSLSGTFSAVSINGQQGIKITSGNSMAASLSSFYSKNVFGFMVVLLRPQNGLYSSFANKNLNLFKFFNSGGSFSEPSLSSSQNLYNFNFSTVAANDITTKSSFWGPISCVSSTNIVNSANSLQNFKLKKPFTQSNGDLLLLIDFHHSADSNSRQFFSSINGKQTFISQIFSPLNSKDIFNTLNQGNSNYTLKLEASQSAGNLVDVYLYDLCFYSFDDSSIFSNQITQNFINDVRAGLMSENQNVFSQSSSGSRQISFSSNPASNIGFDYPYDFINMIGKKAI